jgi:hypothetical protein
MAKRAARTASSASVKDVAKLFRSYFVNVDKSNFADLEDCLKGHMDFMVDLWQLDMFISEGKIKAALPIVWPGMARADGQNIAKALKALLAEMHYKNRRLTSGQKSLDGMKNFLARIGTAALLPVASSSSSQQRAQLPSTSSKRHQPSLTAESISSLYGLSSKHVELSQITVSDDSAMDFVEPKMIEPEKVEPEKAEPEVEPQMYFDHSLGCMVRVSMSAEGVPLTEKSTMELGQCGFANARFPDGSAFQTCIVFLELGLVAKKPAMKKPARAPMKRPAAHEDQAEKSSDGSKDGSEAGGEDGSSGKGSDAGSEPVEELDDVKMAPHLEADGEDGPEVGAAEVEQPGLQRPGLQVKPNQYQFLDGTKMKLGKFSGQSYITVKAKLKLKFQLLICCSDKMAARNGKDHQAIMQSMWETVKSLEKVPDKQWCREQLLQLLA